MKGIAAIAIAIALASIAAVFLPWSISIWIMAVALWYILGFQIIRENEKGVMILLGEPRWVVGPGLHWTPFLLGKYIRYPTGIQELTFITAGVLSRSGKAPGNDNDEREYGATVVLVDATFRFRYPEDKEGLFQCVKLLPPPDLEGEDEGLKNLLEEPILDTLRDVGGKKVWPEMWRDRKQFALDVQASFRKAEEAARQADLEAKATTKEGRHNTDDTHGNIIHDAHLQDTNIAIKHVELKDQRVLDAISAEEVARQTKPGVIIAAEGEKKKLELVGEGAANARKAMIQAIAHEPSGLQVQSLLTLIDMAQGPATTIFPISTNLTDQLSDVLGKGSKPDIENLLRAMTPDQKQRIAQYLMQKGGISSNKGGGKGPMKPHQPKGGQAQPQRNPSQGGGKK